MTITKLFLPCAIFTEPEISRKDKAFLVRFVNKCYGCRLTFKSQRFFLTYRFKSGDNLEKLHISKDFRLGPVLWEAKAFAFRTGKGRFGKVSRINVNIQNWARKQRLTFFGKETV